MNPNNGIDLETTSSEEKYSKSGVPKRLHHSKKGSFFCGDSLRLLQSPTLRYYRGRINLIFTSPPFPLHEKKAYGNLNGQEHLDWISRAAGVFWEMLAPDGSLVVEIGNSWEAGRP